MGASARGRARWRGGARRGRRARCVAALSLALAACASPPEEPPAPRAPDGAEAATTSVPAWVDAPPTRADGRWLVVGVGSGADEAAAAEDARADAAREFRLLQAFQVDATLAAAHRALEDAPREILARLDDAALRAEAEALLRHAAPEGRAWSLPAPDGGHQAWQRVALAEQHLHPDEALRRLLDQPHLPDRALRFVDAGLAAEQAGLPRWAELALLLAEGHDELPAEALLRMARSHLRRGHPLSAHRLLERARGLVAADPDDDRARRAVQAFGEELLGDLPDVAASLARLVQLSTSAAHPELLELAEPPARSSPRATTYLQLRVGRLPARLLAFWIEAGELNLLELPEGGRVRVAGAYHLGLSLNPDFGGARLIVWSLPHDAPVWRAADALSERTLRPGAADTDEHARLALHTLVERLAAAVARPDAAALVVRL